MDKPETKCPECNGSIDWITIHDVGGEPLYNGICHKCNIIFKSRETPELRRGRLMEKELRGVYVLDKRITSLPTDVQLGILRERHRLELEQSK